MRYLNKIIFLNSAHIPYAEIKVDGNVHFIGTQGVGKSTILRAILFFYNADKMHLGIPKEKKNFDSFYLPYSNSYIVYEVKRHNGAFCVLLTKTMGRAVYRFIDAPYNRNWFVDGSNVVTADWSEIRRRIPSEFQVSALITDYYLFRDIIFGNNHKPELMPYRKYAVIESTRYQNIPRTIQNVFLNSKLDADFIKDTIIQSMTDEDICIDLNVYRSLISDFEQVYKDVMLWIKPNQNGVVAVRRDADKVIDNYRGLLYLKQQIVEGRQELNYAERREAEMLPVLHDRIAEQNEIVARFKRLIGEEKQKHDGESAKLFKEIGVSGDKLKTLKQRRSYYEQQNITDVVRRVLAEENLKLELDTNKSTFDDLTAKNSDIIKKYEEAEKRLELNFKEFENNKNAEITAAREKFTNRKEELMQAARTSEYKYRDILDEKKDTLNKQKLEIQGVLSELKHKRNSISNFSFYRDDIDRLTGDVKTLENELNDKKLDKSSLELNISKTRQTYLTEEQKTEWEYKEKINALSIDISTVDKEIERLQVLADSRKGSLCEWLENNMPGWQDTVGKVVDEESVLYSHNLNPQISSYGDSSLFGIELNLSGIERNLLTPEKISSELSAKKKKREELVSGKCALQRELEDKKNDIEKSCSAKIRGLSDELHTVEATLLHLPVKIKKIKADLTTFQRRDEELRKNELKQLDIQILEKTELNNRITEDVEKSKAEYDKYLKQIKEELSKRLGDVEKDFDHIKEEINSEKERFRKETEVKKSELLQSQTNELKGRGADTDVINSYKIKIDRIKAELEYINKRRALVIEYEKDKRELFDHENEIQEHLKDNKARLEDLDEKYRLRNDKLNKKLGDAVAELNETDKKLSAVREDLDAVKNFRKDELLCPVESQTDVEKTTQKTCGIIINELKGLLISTDKKSNDFKKSVNEFNGYFSSNNIFHFVTSLSSEADYYDFANNLCEFVEENKIDEFKTRISDRYSHIIQRISQETGNLTKNESEIIKTIRAINNDFVERNFTGVIKSIELRHQASNDKLMQLLLEIQRFNEENAFNMGALNLFSQDSRVQVNEKAVKYLYSFSRMLQDAPTRKHIVLSDTFNLQFRIIENDNDTGWVEKIANVGSDGTDILVKAMVNIMLINVFKEKASHKFDNFKIHCMMDEIGKLHPQNVKGILDFANCRNIMLINSSPTTFNVEDYRYTYLLSKDKKSNTRVVPLLTRK